MEKQINEEQLVQKIYQKGLNDGRNESPLFVVIPVSVLEDNNLPANAKLLYGEILALSKKSGKCYATNKHLAEALGLKTESIYELLKSLLAKKLISIDLKKNKKGTYRNISGPSYSPLPGGCKQHYPVDVNNTPKIDINKIDINKIDIVKSKIKHTKPIFIFNTSLQELINNAKRNLQVIGIYWKFKEFTFDNKEQFNAALTRELRPAKNLVGYTNKQIKDTMKHLDESKDIKFKWTLETIHKYIDEDLKKLDPSGELNIPSYAKDWQRVKALR